MNPKNNNIILLFWAYKHWPVIDKHWQLRITWAIITSVNLNKITISQVVYVLRLRTAYLPSCVPTLLPRRCVGGLGLCAWPTFVLRVLPAYSHIMVAITHLPPFGQASMGVLILLKFSWGFHYYERIFFRYTTACMNLYQPSLSKLYITTYFNILF